jgi:shikimate dehydrogenase
MTDRYAVIGNPVAHSQSPRIHAMFARALGEDVEYGTILGRAGRFAEDVKAFRQSGGCGLNVTVPFKLDAFELATERSASATYAGAVNTLKFERATILGDNTDGAGLVWDIQDRLGFQLRGGRVLILGAGGAARFADGLGMLLAQAAESFFVWRGVRPETGPLLEMLRGG